jgi:hypothetical protein
LAFVLIFLAVFELGRATALFVVVARRVLEVLATFLVAVPRAAVFFFVRLAVFRLAETVVERRARLAEVVLRAAVLLAVLLLAEARFVVRLRDMLFVLETPCVLLLDFALTIRFSL